VRNLLVHPLALATVFLSLVACGEPSNRADSNVWSGTVDTLPSGRILVRSPDQPLWGEGEGWTLRERFRLGALDSDGPDMFGEIRDVELGEGGELYVLDGQADEVRVFGDDGTHLRTFGRSGEGPGEFNRPAGMALDSQGTLWVMNWGNARYTGFDPRTGEVRREARRLASFAAFPWPGLVDEDGRLFDVGLDRTGEPSILRMDTAFVPRDTMALPRAGDEHFIAFRRGEVMVMATLDPFAPRPAWTPRPRGGIVVGEGAEYRVHRIDFSGDTSMTMELLREPVRVTAAERDSALSVFEGMIEMADGARPDRRPRVPDVKPAHGTLFVDDADRIWVRRTPTPGATTAWDVIGEDGRFLGQVDMPDPPGFVRPSVRGDRVAIVTQPDGVPTVVVYDLVGVVR